MKLNIPTKNGLKMDWKNGLKNGLKMDWKNGLKNELN